MINKNAILIFISLSVVQLNAMETLAQTKNQKKDFSLVKSANTSDVFSPDNKLLARTSFQDCSTILHAMSGNNLDEQVQLGKVECVSFSPDSKCMAYTLLNGMFNAESLNIMDIETGQIKFKTKDPAILEFRPVFKNSPDIMFGISLENNIKRPIVVLMHEKGLFQRKLNLKNVQFFGEHLKSGHIILYDFTNQSIGFYDCETILKRSIQKVNLPMRGSNNLKISHDGNAIAWIGDNRVDWISDLENNKQVITTFVKNAVSDLVFSPNGSHLAITDHYKIGMLNLKTASYDFVFEPDKLKNLCNVGFSKVSWSPGSFLIRFTDGNWIKNEKTEELLVQKPDKIEKKIEGKQDENKN
jgi:WD40 repeat protein